MEKPKLNITESKEVLDDMELILTIFLENAHKYGIKGNRLSGMYVSHQKAVNAVINQTKPLKQT